MPRTGDPAPDIVYTRVLQPPGAVWTPAVLQGRAAVVLFWNNDPREGAIVSVWNELVDRFAGAPVEFIWIAQEADASLAPWLAQRPIGGWMLHDPAGATSRAYGMELLGVAFIDAAGRLAGFGRAPIPSAHDVTALLERPDRLPFTSEPRRLPRKPEVAPSRDAHVTPTGRAPGERRSASLPDFWTREGVRVRELLAELCGVPESRIELRAPIDDDARFDVALVPPQPEDPDTMTRLMREGIARYFNVDIVRETRPTDVFVLTAPHGITGVSAESGGFLGAISMSAPADVESLPADSRRAFFEQRLKAMAGGLPGGLTPEGRVATSGACDTKHLCRLLEGMLGRLVVDEAGTSATFEFNLSTDGGTDGFLAALHDRLGIVVTPDRRDVEMLIVRPR
jgi:uncharacterized protein (TIGR03435 family)